jgi:predicted XRE-type DNA-binding protein
MRDKFGLIAIDALANLATAAGLQVEMRVLAAT